MATLYFCALPSATTPTWNRANIGTNSGFSDSPPMHGTQGSAPAAPQTNYEPTISWTGALTAGQEYKLWAIWDDGSASSDSGVPQPSAAFRTSYSLTASSGTFSYTGGDAALLFNRAVAATGGTFSYSGGNAGLALNRIVAADSGAFAYSGGDAALGFHRRLTAAGGTFSYTGGDATLTYTPEGVDYTLTAASGTFSYTGGVAGLAFNRALPAAGGSFSFSGGAATFSRQYTIAAAGGTFSYSGGAAAFVRTYVLAAESGTFAYSGGDAAFEYSAEPTIVVKPAPGGGKSRKTRKRRVQVEIDGEVFEVESINEAEAVLAEVAQKATETAKLAIDRAAKAKRRPIRKVVRDAEKALTVPEVSVPASLRSYADQMIGKIRAEYQSALASIEIAAQMARREREIEEDDEEVLMLL